MKNIELFDIAVVHFANVLYENFPICIDINIYEEVQKEPFASLKEEDLTKRLVISETLFWLEENDFLKFEKPTQREPFTMPHDPYPFFQCVRLTAKGLTILKSPPKTIEEKQSLGDKMQEQMQTALTQKLFDKLSDVVIDFTMKLASGM